MKCFPRARMGAFAVLAVLLAMAALLPAQDFRPPPSKGIDEATRKAIIEKTTNLGKEIRILRKQGLSVPLLADLDVYHRAAVAIVKHNEFFQKDAAKWALEALDSGLKRARLSRERDYFAWWREVAGKTIVRGHYSHIDGTVQPFAVTYPKTYGTEDKKWRVDVVLHGRDKSLTEVKFIHAHDGKTAPPGDDFVRIDIYGRGNNAYRWAGEVDIYEAIAQFVLAERVSQREKYLDPTRWVLRGFSMGGAGTWQVGLHQPSKWCLLGPGAGFTTTHGYVSRLPAQLPPYQEKCLTIYDAIDYAENIFDVPVVAYGGSKDPQLKAALNIEDRLKALKLKLPLQVLVAPGLGHQFPLEWRKKAEQAYAPFIKKGREDYPKHVRFVTYTLKYPDCDWVRVVGLDRHYERALVDAKHGDDSFKVKTRNVRALRLTVPRGALSEQTVTIDGQKLTARTWGPAGGLAAVFLQKKGGRWQATLPQRLVTDRARRPQKEPGLMGPIDMAFTEEFLCVRGTGKPWHEATAKYAEANLRRFQQEWSKFLRGDLPVKDDILVTSEEIATHHLILFGDPSSNSLIAQSIDALPLKWTKETITVAGKKYASAEHVPVLIYPSPLNATRYVVLNSGHTFHAADFEGTNALLYPRLGDYAVLRLTGSSPLATETATAGLFDEYWQIPKGGR